jgi:gamma-butyrobetaine dioxygenase
MASNRSPLEARGHGAEVPALIGADAAGTAVAVRWAEGEPSRFPSIWLRDNCLCPACRHANGQRLLDVLDIPDDIAPRRLAVGADGALEVAWSDGHASRYPAAWLAAHELGAAARRLRRPMPTLWGADLSPLPEADWPALIADPAAELAALDRFAALGFLLLRRVPLEDAAVAAVGDRLGHVRVTNYGRHFDVRSKPDPNNLADTALALGVHTDNPYRFPAPGIQLLHCLECEAPGGETVLVDGFRAAALLQDEDPDAFARLSRLPLPFRFRSADADLTATTPVIETDFEGAVVGIHFNNRSMAPLDLPEAEIEPWYRAYRAFARLLRRPEGEVRLRLAPGDCVVMMNQRALHGRTAFDPNRGRRHLQGCYIDRDGVESRRRVLARQIGERN